MSDALKWARKRGLNCEQDLMAEQLRQLRQINLWNALRTWVDLCILVTLFKMVGII